MSEEEFDLEAELADVEVRRNLRASLAKRKGNRRKRRKSARKRSNLMMMAR